MYDLGDRVQPRANFGTDQTTVTAVVRAPDGTTTAYSGAGIHHDTTGVYSVNFTADQVGLHEYVFTGDTDVIQDVFQVRALLTDVPPDVVPAGALCSLLDVVKRVPGYDPGDDASIDAILSELLVQESQDFMEVTGREIIALNSDTHRDFLLTDGNVARGSIAIGDADTVTQLQLLDFDTTGMGVIQASLYVLLPHVRRDWQPITRVYFSGWPTLQAVPLAANRSLRVTGTWGFPAIPDTVRRAVATLTLFRYLNEVASAGTKLADIVNRENFNLASALRAAFDVRDRLTMPWGA